MPGGRKVGRGRGNHLLRITHVSSPDCLAESSQVSSSLATSCIASAEAQVAERRFKCSSEKAVFRVPGAICEDATTDENIDPSSEKQMIVSRWM